MAGRRPTDDQLRESLRNWSTLNAVLCGWDLETLGRALAVEREGKRRPYIMLRLHTRRSRLQSKVDWAKLQEGP